jgi:hypothetical protein
MKTKHVLLVAGGLSAIVLAAGGLSTIVASAQSLPRIDLRPLVVTNLGGTLRLIQEVPCDQVVDVTTNATGGRAELTPSEGIPTRTGKTFTMTRLNILYEPFSVAGECQGFRDPHDVTDIGVTLAGAVTLFVDSTGDFVIPKGTFLLKESFVDNKKAMMVYKKPSEDVTGNLDLVGGTMSLRIVIGGRLLFRAGCDRNGENCVINEEKPGTQSTDVRGTLLFPDTDGDGVPDRTDTACPRTPNILCTAINPPGRGFQVSAAPGCGAQGMHLGDFPVGDGDVIQIEETGQPGVKFLGTLGRSQIKRYQVGKGEAIITAADGSSAECIK